MGARANAAAAHVPPRIAAPRPVTAEPAALQREFHPSRTPVTDRSESRHAVARHQDLAALALAGPGYTVTEPATGQALGTLALATPEDVGAAAGRAAAAQRDWARAPHFARAAVLRKAGDLFTAHAAELREWLVRESGSVPGKADFELHVAAQECYEAAALASRPAGQVLPSEAPRLSYTRRVPAGVVGVISPFNAPLILSIRSVAPALALGNAVLLKPDPRTAVCGGLALAAVFAAAGLPAGPAARAPRRRRTPDRPWSPTRACRSSPSPAPPPPGGPWARPPADTSSGPTWNWAATRPWSCWRTPTSTR